jgi:hypothetical protein
MTGTGRRIASSAALLMAVSACAAPPNDVAQGVGFGDYQDYQARRDSVVIPAPQTVRPPSEGLSEPFAAMPPTPAAQGSGRDIAGMAAAAIDEAEFGPPVAPSGDDFVAPPLPEGIQVVGANVAAFALSTSHPVGERVWSRFSLRLGRPEVSCADFRTTDLAQDWFLTNGGPERDPAGLDRNGDGYACNWDPERYRAQAREAAMPRGFGAGSGSVAFGG